uniref:Uncharacterized protein n=1 Tax=Arundo donax TaxID=35708 RepID=A0A0A9BKA1_ARUDO
MFPHPFPTSMCSTFQVSRNQSSLT